VRPAFSVIFLTTLIGAGQGLFLALYAIEIGARLGIVESMPVPRFFAIGALTAAALSGLGLVASFFHLGHPERAWRAAAKWRTSWLSREVIVLPVFIGGVLAYAAAHGFGWMASPSIGFLTLIACIALFVCTGMIYACLKFLQEWASPLTLVNFFLLGAASGTTLAAALAAWLAPVATGLYARSAIALDAGRSGRSRRFAGTQCRLRPRSSLQTAIGIKHPGSCRRRKASWAARSTPASSSRRIAGKAAGDQMGVPAADVPGAIVVAARGMGSGVRAAYGLAFACNTQDCWPSAGTSLRRPIIRRTSITRRFPELACCGLVPSESACGALPPSRGHPPWGGPAAGLRYTGAHMATASGP
jgi:hypothetical protein